MNFFQNHRLHRIILPVLVAITVPMVSVSLFLHPAFAATRTWDGEGTDGACGGLAGDGNKWSCAANWSADTVPVAGDAIVFDGTSTKDATIDASFGGTITSLSINAGYTGTVTMARSLTMSSTYTQAAGIFVQGAQTLTIGGNFAHTAGTFTANTGTVVLTGATPTVSGATTFNNFYVATTTTSDVTLTLPASTTTTVLGATRLLTSTANSLTINKITVVSSSTGVQSSVDFQGTRTIFSAHIKDINNVNAAEIRCYVECVDDGNNTNIRFGEPGFVFTPVTGTVSEAGTTATFTVALRGKPTASVAIPLSVSDSTEASVSPSTITFSTSNYATPQTVTVTGVNDTEDDGGIASSIVLGTPTTGDALYAALNPADVSILTTDDDTAALIVDFDDSAAFTEEDVKGTVAWFDVTDQGEGIFRTGNGGAAVNLSAAKIRPGCRATVGGAEYRILRVGASVTGQVLLTNGVTQPEQLYLTLVDSAVTKIVCTEKLTDTAQLGGGSSRIAALSSDLAGDGQGTDVNNSIILDSVNDRLWTMDPNVSEFIGVSMTTGLETSRKNMATYGYDAAIDTVRNRIWAAGNGNSTVIAFNGATGDYAFGTLGSSAFSVPGKPWAMVYNPELDEIWAGTSLGGTVQRINPTTGAIIATVTLGRQVSSMVYDSTNHAVWVSTYTSTTTSLVKLSAATGTFASGTLVDSSYPIPGNSYAGVDSLAYDSVRNVLWEATDYQIDNIDRLNKIDAATGLVLGSYPTGPQAYGLEVDAAAGKVYMAYSSFSSYVPPAEGSAAAVIVFNADTGERLSVDPTMDQFTDIARQSNGSIWVFGSVQNELDKMLVGAAPEDKFYTVLTTASSDINVAASSTLSSVSASADADGEIISYSLTFDEGDSYRVGSSWRVIASSKASDHGGTEGAWYYRNDADTWTAAPANTAAQALSLAVENGPTNNRMPDTVLNGLTQGQFQGTDGFSASTTSIGVGVTLSTADVGHQPSVDAVTFSFAAASSGGSSGGGGGAPGATPPGSDPSPTPTPTPTPAPEPEPPVISPDFPTQTGLMPGDFVRNAGSSTVYYITYAGTRRPFVTAATFFTYTADFSTVKFVSDDAVTAFAVGEPMPPNPGTVLVKTPSSDKVYAFAIDATVDNPVIRWIPSESLAAELFGPRWADYVIDLDETSLGRLPVGEPMMSGDTVDASRLMRRVDLAKRVRDFLEYATLHMTNLVEWAEAGRIHFPFWPKFHK